jgi:hypothetical protein
MASLNRSKGILLYACLGIVCGEVEFNMLAARQPLVTVENGVMLLWQCAAAH